MKSQSYKLSTLKYRLNEKRRNGEKEVVWQLNQEQKEYLENLGYQIIPWLYRIKTKTFPNVSLTKNKLIKDVHYARKRGCGELYKTLSAQDMELLIEYGVHYSVQKYKIVL